MVNLKIPDGYKTFSDFEEKLQKYREWDFRNRKKNALKTLYYKGIYSDKSYDNPEECDIIGYYDDTRLLIELKESTQKLIIDRNYLKQMQSKTFIRNQSEDEPKIKETKNTSEEPETEQLSLFSV